MRMKNQNGFSLVEIMVAMSLMASLSVVGMQMFKNQSTAQKTVEQNYEVTTVHNHIRNVLANEANCTATFLGQAPTGGTVNRIIYNGQSQFRVGEDLASGVKVLSYTLGNPGSIALVAGKETILNIKYSRGKGTLRDESGKNMKIVYELNAANTIMKCYAFSNQDDTYWRQSDVDSNDIYYGSPSVGDVGVGTPDPTHKFHVDGEVATWGLVNFTASGPRGIMDRALVSMAPRLANGQSFISLIGKQQAINQSTYFGYNHYGDGSDRNGATIGVYGQDHIMTVLGNRRVGINTSDPYGTLHLAGNGDTTRLYLRPNTMSTNQRSQIIFEDPDNGSFPMTISYKDRGTSLGRFGILGGPVGIGTDEPTRHLHVFSDTTAEMVLENGAGPANFRKWNIVADGGTGAVRSNFSIRQLNDAGSGGPTSFFIKGENANVGIGDTDPAQKLTIAGNVQIGGNVAANGTSPALYFGTDFNNTDTMRIFRQNYTSDVTHMVFHLGDNPAGGAGVVDSFMFSGGGATPAMQITSDGRVGINRPNPSVALEVGGRAKFDPNSSLTRIPTGWGGGVHAWDVYAEGTIGTGTNGNLGFQVSAAGTGRFGGDLNVEGTLFSSSFMYTSDGRLKKDVSTIDNPLEKIRALRGVNFTWIKQGSKDVGFIAQEVEKVEPRLVGTAKDGTKSVKYGNIIAIVVEAIKELFNGQEDLREEVRDLKAQNEQLKARLDAQEQLLRDLASKN